MYTVPVSQLVPVQPTSQVHLYEPRVSLHCPWTQGDSKHSLISEISPSCKVNTLGLISKFNTNHICIFLR